MKAFVFSAAALLVFSVSPAVGKSLPLADGRSLALPERFLLDESGVAFLRDPDGEMVEVDWDDINSRKLALTQPDIDRLRNRAVEEQTRIYVEQASAPNPYREFLEQTIYVEFNTAFEAFTRTRRDLRVSTKGFGEPSGEEKEHEEESDPSERFITGESETLKRLVETTPYPIDTTIEGFLFLIGDDTQPHSRTVIRELQSHGAFFQNLIIGLRNLAETNPRDHEIHAAIRAMEDISNGRAISVDSQRQIHRFAEHARQMARE